MHTYLSASTTIDGIVTYTQSSSRLKHLRLNVYARYYIRAMLCYDKHYTKTQKKNTQTKTTTKHLQKQSYKNKNILT